MAFDLSKVTSFFEKKITTSSKKMVVGIDIGSSAIKIVQLYDNKGTPTLETYGELQLGPYENSDIGRTTHLHEEKLREAFVDILRESSVTAKKVALAISYSGSFSSIIPVPTSDIASIAAMIPVEARKYVPVPLAEVTLDWFPVSSRSDGTGTNVLLVAIHNGVLKKYETMVRTLNLESTLTEIEMFSTIRSAVSQKDTSVAVIDIGAGSTKVYIAEQGVVAKTHSLLMSGVLCTKAIADAARIPFKEAEELKRRYGLSEITEYPLAGKALLDVVERGFREIAKVIERFEESGGTKVEKIVLAGSGALLQGIPSFGEQLFSRTVSLADPFSKVAYPAFLEDTLKEAGPSFAVSVGVAIRALGSL